MEFVLYFLMHGNPVFSCATALVTEVTRKYLLALHGRYVDLHQLFQLLRSEVFLHFSFPISVSNLRLLLKNSKDFFLYGWWFFFHSLHCLLETRNYPSCPSLFKTLILFNITVLQLNWSSRREHQLSQRRYFTFFSLSFSCFSILNKMLKLQGQYNFKPKSPPRLFIT